MTRTKRLLLGLPLLVTCVAAMSGYLLWAELTRPAVDVRRATMNVLPAHAGSQTLATAERVDVRRHELPRIEPGTKIDSQTDGAVPLVGSHLVLHGTPRIAAGDKERVPAMLSRLVSMFHLTIIAEVADDPAARPAQYHLQNVAIGLAADVAGQETILSSATQKSIGADLGLMERNTLSGNEACLDQALQVARTPTMLVFDATAIMRLDDDNRHVLHRHAVLVRPTDGRLSTFVWTLIAGADEKLALAEAKIRLLPPALDEDRQLYVDASRFVLGLPSQEAFALVDLPPGNAIRMNPKLQAAAESTLTTPDEVLQLERLLRGEMDGIETAP